MKPLAFALVLAAASNALAGDAVHTAKDLDKGLKDLAWLLGNWEADGDFMGTKYKEYVRYWPVVGGKALMERAYAVVEGKTVIHEDRIVFTRDDAGLKASFYEAKPARVTRYEIKTPEGGIEFAPLTASGPKLVYTKTGDDSYDYIFTSKDEKGGDIKATGKAKRTKDNYPEPKSQGPGESLKPLSSAVGNFEGVVSAEDDALMIEHVKGRAILGGDVLELALHVETKGPERFLRAWLWFDAASKAWCLDRLDGFGTLLSFGAKLDGGKVKAKCVMDHLAFEITWSWDAKGYILVQKRFAEWDLKFKSASFGLPVKKKGK
jgi:hypothetical protein